MDIDEFLDREISGLGLDTGNTKGHEIMQFKEEFEPSSLFENIKANLSKGNLEIAEQSYIQLWRILMQQKLKWNKELYEQLLSLSRQFSSALSYAYNDVKRKASQIYELISRAKNALREGKKEMPFKLYSEVQQINNSIPNVFFEEKKMLQEQILDFYKELKDTTDNELLKRVSSLIQELHQLIVKIDTSISHNDMVSAIVSYNKCVELYNQVPEGFLRHKNAIGMRILGFYKGLSIYTEISSLQRQLGQQPLQFQQRSQHSAQASELKAAPPHDAMPKSMLLSAKKERAKKNIEKGFYNEASKDIQEALQLEPSDAEAKAIHAKIKTLQ